MHLRDLLAAGSAAALLFAPLAISTPALAQTKTIKAVMHSDLKVLDTIWTTANIVRNHGYMVWDTLFAMDEKLQPQPQMVDAWSLSDDKLTYTFTLRDGLKWHDGKPVTVEDVIFSLETLREKGQPFFRFYYRDVSKAEKVGERKVKFTFGQTENRELPLIIAQLPILPKH